MTDQTADRPFADEPTEVLRAALGLASRHAEQAARFRPAQPGDALPAVVDLLRAELQHREGTLLPPPEGPEYTPCSGCTHIEPEHRPDAGPCLVCDCRAYAPAAVFAAVAPPTDQTAAPTVWVDGHPQLEAIAAAVWEQCRTEGTSLVVDDPRNIAVAALAALRRMADETATETHQPAAGARQDGAES